MRSLTLKQQLTLTTSVVVFLFLFIFGSLFHLFFRWYLTHSVQKDVLEEAYEIVNTYILTTPAGLTIKNNQADRPLSEELHGHNLSLLLLNSEQKIIDGYGLFEYYQENEDRESLLRLINLSNRSVSQRQLGSERLEWRGNRLLIYAIPLLKGDQIAGVVLIGKSLDEINLLLSWMLVVYGILGIFGLAGSILIGSALSNRLLLPIKKLLLAIDQVDLHRLDSRLKIGGDSKGEIAVLGRRFNQMLDRIDRMAKQQRSVITHVSHELKTPLARTISSLALLEKGNAHPNEIREVKDELFQLNQILDSLITISKIAPDEAALVESVTLTSSVNRVLQMYQTELDSKLMEVKVQVDARLKVCFSMKLLDVVVGNIVSNAIKYSPAQSGLEIGASQEDAEVVLSVKDFGEGMTKVEAEQIFNRFYRGHRKAGVDGLGVGMALVKHICDLYQAKISVSSKKGEGTEIKVCFKKCELDEKANFQERRRK